MKTHLYKEIRALDQKLYEQAAEVAETLGKVVKAFLSGNTGEAEKIIEHDEAIDRNEIFIEEECLKLLALYQPVAGDLRYIITVLKVNGELERIGDLAVDIAEFTARADVSCTEKAPVDFESMTASVRRMLDSSIKALSGHNVPLATEVIMADEAIDDLHNRFSASFPQCIREDSENIPAYQALLGVSRSLERIADCATNIAEDVIYLESGRIVRHASSCLLSDEVRSVPGIENHS